MASIFYKLFHHEIFQGSLTRKKYFEGWYFKLVSADQSKVMALIPGIAIFNKDDRHAFIQVFNGVDHTASYHRFPIESFRASEKEFDVSIGSNHFTSQGISVDLPDIKGEIKFSNMMAPASTWLSPGAMGWFSYVPYMECRHEVVSLHHDLSGVTIGTIGKTDWKGGAGYIEKDWGKSFPKCWIWMHCNHFESGGQNTLMASVARIPWMGRSFPGFIVILLHDGIEYRFATYNHAKMKCAVDEDCIRLEFKRKNIHLLIRTYKGKTAELHMPVQGQMTGKMNESLDARIEISLRKDDQEIWSSIGTTAGLDVFGDTLILESSTWRK